VRVSRRRKLEERVRRTRQIVYESEREVALLKADLIPSDQMPVVGERTLRMLDWINTWVGEARTVHRLAERELTQYRERRPRCSSRR
jgi:hypothetical protein